MRDSILKEGIMQRKKSCLNVTKMEVDDIVKRLIYQESGEKK